ncbi:amino acid permease 2 [Eucalyptus grandis]|nr:amino acid permease 2 [Eucalyptus grandis]
MASARIITAVIGQGVLPLVWAMAQLGWLMGPAALLLLAVIIICASALLANCYRTGDSIIGERNLTYVDAIQNILGGANVKLCELVYSLNLFGVVIGFTIAASISMTAINKSNCFHDKGDKSHCQSISYPYTIAFGVTEIVLSQIRNFDKRLGISIMATIMSLTYSTIGLALGIAKVAENGELKGSLTGISLGTVTQTQKIWRSFQALGNIVFAYSFAILFIEIQDTIKSPPPEAKTMRKATLISVAVLALFYMLCGSMGYGAFGDMAPGHLLAGFGFFSPYWLIDLSNAAITIHLVIAYQVHAQPLFAFMEKQFITSEIEIEIPIPIPGFRSSYTLCVFQLIWRTIFVIATTVISMLLPFFNEVIGLVGALGFWPLTVYFPVEMYIAQMKIHKWSTKWIGLQILSIACLIISVAATMGSIAGIVLRLQSYKPFGTSY